ncbi:hypothetical protein L0P44_15430, partial [Streptococcus gordonii]|nr:hypothetical protein [Streptococcus gordonii]
LNDVGNLLLSHGHSFRITSVKYLLYRKHARVRSTPEMSSHRRSTLARTDENLSDDSDLVKVELDRRLAAKDHQR